ncbi:hypothetical protein AAH140_12240 [Bacteroides thetaiotaomicron]
MMTSIENGREKDEARQIVADFGSKGLVRLTTQGTAYSGMKPGRTPGIGNMPFAGKMETAQAGMPSDQPIGLLLRWILTDGDPTIGVCGYQCGAVLSVPSRRNGETEKGKKAERCLVCKAAR